VRHAIDFHETGRQAHAFHTIETDTRVRQILYDKADVYDLLRVPVSFRINYKLLLLGHVRREIVIRVIDVHKRSINMRYTLQHIL
jgi:hypothetical protein